MVVFQSRMVRRFTLEQIGSKAYLQSCVKLKPHDSHRKSCDCGRPVESRIKWHYFNAEVGNVEEPMVEYGSVADSIWWSECI